MRCTFVGALTAEDAIRCRRFGLPVAEHDDGDGWTVRRTPTLLLELRAPRRDGALAIDLDLRGGALGRRLKTARRDQPLARAIGLHRRDGVLHVVDATAGLGRDALLLATLGCVVAACERIPALAMLLDDATERANLGGRLTVHCTDAVTHLDALGPASTDVVYLDPMFPSHGRAQVKKEMQVCRLLAGPPESAAVLVHRARAAARDRVVVKRHPHELPLAGPPTFTVDGERVRFDVYLTRPAAPPPPAP